MMTRSAGSPAPDVTPVDAASAMMRGAAAAPSDDSMSWVVDRGALIHATRMGDQGASEFALIIDDRDAAVGAEGFTDVWRLWLHLSNVIGWRNDLSGVEILALSQVVDAGADTAATDMLGHVDFPLANVSIEWKTLAEGATSAEKALIAALAAAPGVPIPKMGLELGDGIPFSFVWEDERVATAWGLDDDDREFLASLGWTAVEPEADAVMNALASAGRN